MKKLLATAVAIGLAGMMGSAMAITDDEATLSLPFSFSNPGARALGMGGAFIGLADDASAAYSNPAGLTQLVSPEVSAEFRSDRADTRWVDGGGSQGDPFSRSGLNYSSQTDATNSLRSFSFVYPGERYAFSVYRFELVNYSSRYASAGEVIDFSDGTTFSIFPYGVDSNVQIDTYGAALAFKASDRLSFGLGLNYYYLDIASTTSRFVGDFATGFTPLSRSADVGQSGKFGATLGARLVFNDWLSMGASYRFAPTLGYKATLSAPSITTDTIQVDSGVNIPDFMGIGFSIRPSESWTINLDINRVMYSQVTNNIDSVFDSDQAIDLDPLKLDDGTEVHLGVEYTFATAHPFSIRAGTWHDPAHELVYRGQSNAELLSANEVIFSSGRGSQTHYTIGAGMAFKTFQIDIGADFADSADVMSLSGVYRF